MRLKYKLTIKKFIYELLIIVFGVLIALAVDNYANEISDRKKERDFLESFLNDLQRDTISFNSDRDRYIERDSAALSLIKVIHTDFPLNENKLCDYIQSIISIIEPPINNSAFRDIEGNLNLIKSKGLRIRLIRYYTWLENEQRWARDIKSELSHSFSETVTDLLTYDEFAGRTDCDVGRIQQKMKGNLRLLNYLERTRKVSHWGASQLENDIEWAKELIIEINKELKK